MHYTRSEDPHTFQAGAPYSSKLDEIDPEYKPLTAHSMPTLRQRQSELVEFITIGPKIEFFTSTLRMILLGADSLAA